jgi:serine protease SohB
VHDFLFQYGLFLAKAVTWLLVFAALAVLAAGVARTAHAPGGERLEIKNLNRHLRRLAEALQHEMLGSDELKRERKRLRAEDKARRRAAKTTPRPRLFVLNFLGDINASHVESLREEINALLQVSRPGDEVLLRLESAGGVVHGYGLAAVQLRRLRDGGLKLTAAVDKVAASGGYMMACVADRILAAPFAIVGSIGVVAQLPNFSRWLRERNIDYELHTAGEYKRTLTLFGENTEAGRAKFREELEHAHVLFKDFIAANRPALKLDLVATGEHWFGSKALELGLVDVLRTSDDYLLERVADADVFELHFKRRRSPLQQLLGGLGLANLRFPL